MESRYEKSLQKDIEKFLSALGLLLKEGREASANSDVKTFAAVVDVDVSTVYKVERGKVNIKLSRLYTFLRGQGKSHDQIVKMFLPISQNEEDRDEFTLTQETEQQVRQQVEKKLGKNEADSLDQSHIERIYLLVSLCVGRKLRKRHIQQRLGLSSYTRHFDRCLDVCLKAGWIKMTKPDQPNSNDQSYYTTDSGLNFLRLEEE